MQSSYGYICRKTQGNWPISGQSSGESCTQRQEMIDKWWRGGYIRAVYYTLQACSMSNRAGSVPRGERILSTLKSFWWGIVP